MKYKGYLVISREKRENEIDYRFFDYSFNDIEWNAAESVWLSYKCELEEVYECKVYGIPTGIKIESYENIYMRRMML